MYAFRRYKVVNYARWPQMYDQPESTAWRGDAAGVGTLPLDLYETGDEVVVTASLPGLTSEDVELTVQGGILRIQGELKQQDVPDAQFHRLERPFGCFAREVALPANVQADAVEARFDNGILTLRLPKTEAAKTRRIPIQDMARPQIAEPVA